MHNDSESIKLGKLNLARAALHFTNADARLWPGNFVDEQAELIVNGTCDARAHDTTCVAAIRYERLLARALDPW